MNRLIEVSVRGKIYYFLNDLSPEHMEKLEQLSKDVFSLNIVSKEETDDEIIAKFVMLAQKNLEIYLRSIAVDSVLVIK